jgi:hypothetical protein
MGVSIYFICNFCFLNMRKLDFWSLPQCLFYCLIVCWLSFISEIKADFLLRIRQDRDISWQLIFLYFLGKKVSIYFVKFRLNLWKSKYVRFKKTGDKLSYNNMLHARMKPKIHGWRSDWNTVYGWYLANFESGSSITVHWLVVALSITITPHFF